MGDDGRSRIAAEQSIGLRDSERSTFNAAIGFVLSEKNICHKSNILRLSGRSFYRKNDVVVVEQMVSTGFFWHFA